MGPFFYIVDLFQLLKTFVHEFSKFALIELQANVTYLFFIRNNTPGSSLCVYREKEETSSPKPVPQLGSPGEKPLAMIFGYGSVQSLVK